MIGNSIQFNWSSSYFIQIQFLQIANQAYIFLDFLKFNWSSWILRQSLPTKASHNNIQICYNTKPKKSNISCTNLCINIHVTTNMYVQKNWFMLCIYKGNTLSIMVNASTIYLGIKYTFVFEAQLSKH